MAGTRPGPTPVSKALVQRSRLVRPNLELFEQSVQRLNASGSSGVSRLALNLFDDVSLTAILETSGQEPEERVWRGSIEGVAGSYLTLVERKGALAGSIQAGGSHYRIRPAGRGLAVIEEVDYSALPEELSPIQANLDSGENRGGATAHSVRSDDPSPPSEGRAPIHLPSRPRRGATIDVLVPYTSAAKDAEGGKEGIEARITLAIEETNQAFANSNVAARLRLAAAVETAYDETNLDFPNTLYELWRQEDRAMDEIHALRDLHQADAVILWVASQSACGIAFYIPDVRAVGAGEYAFAVVSRSCSTGHYTFAHELGHILGCNHQRETAESANRDAFNFAYARPGEFRTIMAVASSSVGSGTPRIPHFSNPEVSFNGLPTGIRQPDPLSANNAQTLNNAVQAVAEWNVNAPTVTLTPGAAQQGGAVYLSLINSFCAQGFEVEVSEGSSAEGKARSILETVNLDASGCSQWRAERKDAELTFFYLSALQWQKAQVVALTDTSGGPTAMSVEAAASFDIYLTPDFAALGQDIFGEPSTLRVLDATIPIEPNARPEEILGAVAQVLRARGLYVEYLSPTRLSVDIGPPFAGTFTVQTTDYYLLYTMWLAVRPRLGGAGLIDR